MKNRLLLFLVMASVSFSGFSQKRTLEWDDVVKWNRIVGSSISDSGEYIVAASEPWVGDGKVGLYSSKGVLIEEFERAESPLFVGNNTLLATIKPAKALTDSLKLKGVKSDKLPRNQLLIYNIKEAKSTLIDSLQSYKTSAKNGVWAAYRSGRKNRLVLTNFDDVEERFDNVDQIQFSKERGYAIFNQSIRDSISQIVIYNLSKKGIESTFEVNRRDKFEQLTVSESGKAAYIVKGRDKSGKDNKICYWDGESCSTIDISGLESGWIVNEVTAPYFAKESDRLLFGISPAYPVTDTTILSSEKAKVDVWIWDEAKLKSQQVVDYQKDIKKAYLVMFDLEDKQLSQISTLEYPYAHPYLDGDSDFALVEATEPYDVQRMWEGGNRRDIYIKNIKTGDTTPLLEGIDSRVAISPEAKYLYWYQPQDSSWNVYSNLDSRMLKLTTPEQIVAYDDSGNRPELPAAFGSAGWSEGDETLYIYDKYDVWALDPTGGKEPRRITDGYKDGVTYRIVKLDRDQESFSKSEKVFLSLFDNHTKQSGYAETSLNKTNSVKILTKGDYSYGRPQKAKESDRILFTRENFEEFPNLYLSNSSLKGGQTQITDLNPQQSEFNWGTAELISWVSLQGDTLQGCLYRPEDFDPNKKYPMICNFYELRSQDLFVHKTPEPHRSTIDYHYYTSNGYVIFAPDLKYIDGYPGEGCYNSLMPGIMKVLDMGFVDPKCIGAQGHSWGGYQTAYLATRTNLFAAIESGAPVVNMISAYGGIRWATGKNRAFQYETGQSRIGASPWEAPSRYTENSPIYTMDKVTTPILIMHNDSDGHVPWWQGIEFFVALRRLEKPAWMLNYNGEPHWPMRQANRLDFQTKMSQFFDHYLKGTEFPEWMKP